MTEELDIPEQPQTEDPFKKFGGKQVAAPKSDPFAKFGGQEVKKKEPLVASSTSTPASSTVGVRGPINLGVPAYLGGSRSFLDDDIDLSFSLNIGSATPKTSQFSLSNLSAFDKNAGLLEMSPEKQTEAKKTIIKTDPEALKEYRAKRIKEIDDRKQELISKKSESTSLIPTNQFGNAKVVAVSDPDTVITDAEIIASDEYKTQLQKAISDAAKIAVPKSFIEAGEPIDTRAVGQKYLETIGDPTVSDNALIMQQLANNEVVINPGSWTESPRFNQKDVDRTRQGIEYKLDREGSSVMSDFWFQQAQEVSALAPDKIQAYQSAKDQRSQAKSTNEQQRLDGEISLMLQDSSVQAYQQSLKQAEEFAKRYETVADQYPQVKRAQLRQQLNDTFLDILSEDHGSFDIIGGLFGRTPSQEQVAQIAQRRGLPVEQVQAIVDEGGFFKDVAYPVRTPGLLQGVASGAAETIEDIKMGINRFFGREGVEAENAIRQSRLDQYLVAPQGSKLKDDFGKWNINAYSIFNTMGRGIGQTTVYAAPTLATGGLAAAGTVPARLIEAATTVGVGYAGSYESAYQEAARYTDDEAVRRSYANITALENALPELIMSPADIVRKISPKGNFESFATDVAKEGIEKTTANKMAAFGKQFGDVILAENVEEAVTNVTNNITKENMLGVDMSGADWLNQAIETAVQTTLTTLPLGIGSGLGGVRDISGIRKEALFEAGNEPELYRIKLQKLADAGTINQAELNKRVQIVNTMSDIVAGVNKLTKPDGSQFSYEEKAQMAAQQFRIRNNKEIEKDNPVDGIKPVIEADTNEAIKIQQDILADSLPINIDQNETERKSPTGQRENKGAETGSQELGSVRTEVPEQEREIIPTDANEPVSSDVSDDFTISEVIDRPITYNGQAARVYQDGQTVVVKIDGQPREYELGNVEDLTNTPISEFGIDFQESVVSVDETGALNVRGTPYVNLYSDPLAAINRDEEGNVVSVNLETEDGKKRTFRGNVAEDLAYQINLQEITKDNETRQQFEDFLNTDEVSMELGSVPEVTTEETVSDNTTVQREPAKRVKKPKKIKENAIQEQIATESVLRDERVQRESELQGVEPKDAEGLDTKQSKKEVKNKTSTIVTGTAFHGITGKDTNSRSIYLGDESLANDYSPDSEVEEYEYTLNRPYIVESDSDFGKIKNIIDDFTEKNPESKWHPDTTDHINNELEKEGYDGLIIKQEALETDKGYEDIGGTYGEAQIVVFDRKNVKKKGTENEADQVLVATEDGSTTAPATDETKQGTGAVPPTTGQAATEEGEEESAVGITQAAISEMRNRLGLGEYERTRVSDASLEALADQIIAEGYDINTLLAKIEDGNQPTALETVILGKYKPILDAEVSTNPTDDNLRQARRFAQAVDISGTEEGRMFRLRRFIPAGENSLSDFFVREMDTDQVDVLTESQKEVVTKEYNDIQSAEKQASDALLKLQEAAAEQKAKEAVGKEKQKTPRQKKSKEDFAKERENITNKIKDKLKRFRSGEEGLSAVPVPYARELFAIAPDVAQLVRSYVAEGVDNLVSLTENVYDAVKEIIPEVTKKDIHDLIAGEYNVNARTKSEITEKVRDIRDEAKLLNKLEKLLAGEQPKNDVAKRERNRQITELRRQINDIQRRNRIDERESNRFYGEDFMSDSDRLRQAAAQYTRQAEKMEEGIRNGIYAPEEKRIPLTQDPELKRNFPELHKQAVDAQDRLIKARKDREIRLANQLYNNRKGWQKFWDIVSAPIREVRTLKSSFDFSAPLRQGIIPTISEMIRNPVASWNRMRRMVKSSADTKYFDRWMDDLRSTPMWDVMKKSGLAISDPNTMDSKEEVFQSKYAQKIPGVKGSERAYAYYLNSQRVSMFTEGVNIMMLRGMTYDNSKDEYKNWANTVNTLTGRGKLTKALENASGPLSMAFFSPRLMAARLSMFNPFFYKNIPAPLRKMVARDVSLFASLTGTILGAVALFASDDDDPWSVSLDPGSPDFMKLKNGNTRYDILGGFVQYMRLFIRLGDKGLSEIFGYKTDNIKDGKAGDVLTTAMRSKFSPALGTAWNLVTGKNVVGEKVTLKEEATKFLLPLVAVDTYEALRDRGPIGLASVTLPASLGVGVQTYDEKKKK